MKQLQKILTDLKLDNTVEEYKTTTDPATNGIVQCKTTAAKINFYREAKEVEAYWENEKRMWWKNNDSIEKRVRDKTLGMIKHKMASKEIDMDNIKILWTRGDVRVNSKTIARLSADGKPTFMDIGKTIEAEVTEAMEEWKANRDIDL